MDVSKQIWLIHTKDNTIHWLDIESARQLLAGESAISLIDTYHKCIIGNWYCLRGQNDSSIRQFTAAFRPELLPVLENMMIDNCWSTLRDIGNNIPSYRCSSCKTLHYGYPAISRCDNHAKVCPICGVAQALAKV